MKYERQDHLIKILLKYFKGIAPLAIYDMVETLWPRDSGDEKVKFDIGDPVSGYLWDKVKAGPGVILTEGEGTDANKVIISAPGGGTPLDIVAGDGMDFVTNTSVKLGTPSTVDKTTTNSVTTHSHTHQLGHVYDWKLHSPDQIVGDLDEPENIVPSINGTGAVDTTIPAGTYAIVAINAAGETLPVDVPEMVIKEDTTAVVVSWDAVPGATAYKVYEVSTGLYYDLISNVWLYLTQTPATAGTLPTTNTALVYQSEFTIDDADIVKIIGDGIDIETYAEPGDSTIKVVKIIKQRTDWNATEGPNVLDNKPTIPENTDEKVKYDAADPTAGYLSEKIIAGTNVTIEEGTGPDENKLKINATGGGISTVETEMSVTGDGSVETPVKLVGDEETPGNSKYYGTNSSGEKGYHSLPSSSGLAEKEFEFCIVAGVEQTFDVDIYATVGYTITKAILESDGTLNGVQVKIAGTAVTGLNSMTVSTVAVFTATALNVASEGDRVTIVTSGSDTGTPTILKGKIVIG